MKILYFAPIPFDRLKQRPQYLAEGLAKEHELIYVEPTVSIMKYLMRGGETPGARQRCISETLCVMRLDGRRTAHRSMEAILPLLCVSERRQIRPLLQWADLVWIGYSPWYSIIRQYQGKLVFDKMDDDQKITYNPLLKKLITRTEPELIERADMVIVTAQRFYDEIKPIKEQTYLVRNATDIEQERKEQPALKKEPDTCVFGYIGLISHWFDMDAVSAILDADEKNRVILVGPTEISKYEHPRLKYVGMVPKEEISGWIESFDVCLYPFKQSDFLDTINPVKVYEYLAHGKPVLAANSVEIRTCPANIERYETEEDLCRILKSKKEGGWTVPFQTEQEKRVFIRANNWNARTTQIISLLEKMA